MIRTFEELNFRVCSDRIFDYSAMLKTTPSCQILLIPKCSVAGKFYDASVQLSNANT